MAEKATTGDPYVLNVQNWLNSKYGSDSRYNTISEDGRVGWNTIYALIRALQIELGIQATADNFGTGTQNAFKSKFPNGVKQQSDNDESADNIYGIIQGALICKGYDFGASRPTCHFYNSTGEAIKRLKSDAGLADTSSTVTLNLMKALLSMDYFKSYDTSEKTQNIISIQRYLNRNYEAYIGIRPCDGVYSRSTNQALIYAIQAEEGLPVSTANGNFGPSTKRCCPTIPYNNSETNYTGHTYTSEKIANFIKLAQIGLYVNGIDTFKFNGEYDSDMKNDIKNFQGSYAIPVTEKIDLTTWLSLFISSGDTSRSAKACDCATILTSAKAKTLYDNGYRYVGRYLSGNIASGASKALSQDELKIAFDAGLKVFPIQQASANKVSYFTEEQAKKDVESALDHAIQLGIPQGTIIYFAVDCDPLDSQITSNIIPYFRVVSDLMKVYKVGIYGTRNVCIRVSEKGYAVSSFVSDMSTGFSGNLGFPLPKNWAFDQFATVTIGSGDGKIEIDKDGFSGSYIGVDSIDNNDILKVYNNLSKIYKLALQYTNQNIHESNLLILEYLRYLKGGEYGGSIDGEYKAQWLLMAGNIDSNFCNIVNENLSSDIDLTFHDPIKTKVEYDLLHMAATLNAILYPVIDENLEAFDAIVDHFAGWAGDVVTYGADVMVNGNNQEWANANICTDVNYGAQFETKFGLADYLGDADAVVIASMLNSDSTLSFPEAFIKYFNSIDKTTGKLYVATRTNRFMLEMGTYNQFVVNGELYLTSDTFPYPTLRNMIKEDGTEQEHINKAYIAFAIFVGNQLLEEDNQV